MNASKRDFRAELQAVPCWDQRVQELYETHGEPLADAVLQNREELIGLCEIIEAHRIRSYLEIGLWTGRLLSALDQLFDFELLAACDHGWAAQCGLELRVPAKTRLLRADSDSDEYLQWRAELGHIDLVFIDANHSYRAVQRDFAINRRYPHRFLALHDITGASRHTAGVGRFWRELDEGHRREIVEPHRELGLARSTMGIGIWSRDVAP